MKRKVVLLALASMGLSLVSPVFACGDKFLVPVRGSRFQQAPALRSPASILLYANPASPLPAALNRLGVDSALRKVGYRPTIVDSAEGFARAVNQAAWDVIVLDVRDRASLPSHLQASATTAVVPIAQNPTREELAAARKVYTHVAKTPARAQAFVDLIDDALAAREHGSKLR